MKFKVQSTEYRIFRVAQDNVQRTSYTLHNIKYKVHNTRDRIPITEQKEQSAEYRAQNTE